MNSTERRLANVSRLANTSEWRWEPDEYRLFVLLETSWSDWIGRRLASQQRRTRKSRYLWTSLSDSAEHRVLVFYTLVFSACGNTRL